MQGKEKQELLYRIRNEISDINSDFAKIEVKEQIPLVQDGTHVIDYSYLLGLKKMKQTVYYDGNTQKSYPINELLGKVEDSKLQALDKEVEKVSDPRVKKILMEILNTVRTTPKKADKKKTLEQVLEKSSLKKEDFLGKNERECTLDGKCQ